MTGIPALPVLLKNHVRKQLLTVLTSH